MALTVTSDPHMVRSADAFANESIDCAPVEIIHLSNIRPKDGMAAVIEALVAAI